MIAGSLPPGAEADQYAALIAGLRGAGVPTLLDTDGEPMRVGLRAQPSVVAPNVAEAEEAVGYEFTEPGDLITAVDGLVGMGAEEAIITTPSGCVAMVGDGHARSHYEATIEPLATVASVGSGDAFLAGFVAARRAGRPIEDCLAYGVACGAESTQHLGAGTIDGVEAAKLTSRVQVERLDRTAAGRLAVMADVGRPPERPFPRSFRTRALLRPVIGGAYNLLSAVDRGSATSWKLRSDGERRLVVPTGSTTSRSCPRGGRGTPTTSTSPGTSAPTGSSCRCSPRRWTASSARGPRR